MTLDARLKAVRDAATPEGTKLYDDLIAHLRDSGALDGVLKPGMVFPDFALPNDAGRIQTRSALLEDGPAVIVFDRGAWCSYCTVVLGELANVSADIRKAGASIAAVTPEAVGGGARLKTQCGVDFDVLADLDNVLGMECGLMFPVPDAVRKRYMELGIDLERINGNDMWLLPAPATFVVGRDAVIRNVFLDIDFRFRVEPAEILKAVRDLR
jgi:peroxiredoxin